MEDGALVLEQLENALINDDDRGEMPPPSTSMVSLTKTPAATIRDSCSIPLPLPPASDQLPPHGGSQGNRGGPGGAKRKEN